MSEVEELFIKKLRTGDERVFGLLYDRHYVLLCRLRILFCTLVLFMD